jgi:hypothetical protein
MLGGPEAAEPAVPGSYSVQAGKSRQVITH